MSRMSSIVGMCEESVERQNGLDLHEMNTWKKRGLLPIHFPFWIAMPRFEWNNRIMACVIVAHVFRNYFFTIELFHHNKHKHVYLDHPSPPKKHEAFKQTSSVFWDVCFFFFRIREARKNFFHKPLVGKNMALLLIDWGSPSRQSVRKVLWQHLGSQFGNLLRGGGKGPWLWTVRCRCYVFRPTWGKAAFARCLEIPHYVELSNYDSWRICFRCYSLSVYIYIFIFSFEVSCHAKSGEEVVLLSKEL